MSVAASDTAVCVHEPFAAKPAICRIIACWRFDAQAEVCCRDPDGTTLAFADMMKKQIVMPAHMMDDMVHKGRTGRNIFQDFSTVAESTGTYTAQVSHRDLLLYHPACSSSMLTPFCTADTPWL